MSDSASTITSAEDFAAELEACRPFLLLIAREELAESLRAKADASDLVQETFLEAQRDAVQYHGRTRPELMAWLRGILRNNLTDFHRRFQMRKRAATQELPLIDTAAPQLASADPSPSGVAMLNEEQGRLHEAMARLPEMQQRILRLRHFEGLSFPAIADRTGLSVRAVRLAWFHALERLQAELEQG